MTKPKVATIVSAMKLEHLIAKNVADVRRERGATQADIAARMRSAGFDWSTNRVAQVETLRRNLPLLEVVGLSYVLGVPVTRLLAGDEDIDLPDGSTWEADVVRRALEGTGNLTDLEIEAQETTAVEEATKRDELRKIAGRIGVTQEQVEGAAVLMWGRSFFQERDARAGDLDDLPPRSAQTIRGHHTRKMINEVRRFLEEHRTGFALDHENLSKLAEVVREGDSDGESANSVDSVNSVNGSEG